jgi:DNA-binding GntR family transcriptional regulator
MRQSSRAANATTGSVSAAFRLLGLPDFHRRETLISTRLPSPFEALCLDIPPSQPIIVARGVNVDKRDQVVEVSESLSRGDRVRFQA